MKTLTPLAFFSLTLLSTAPLYATDGPRAADSLPAVGKSAVFAANASQEPAVRVGVRKSKTSPLVYASLAGAIGVIIAISTGNGRSPG